MAAAVPIIGTAAGAGRIAHKLNKVTRGGKFWTKSTTFDGVKVYQRSDIFDPKAVSSWKVKGKTVTGTNVRRMASGRAPIGVDGKPVNLHHMTQTNTSGIAEMTQTFHKTNHGTIHICQSEHYPFRN